MTDGIEKLKQDLKILEVMVEEMPDYLRTSALFGKPRGWLPAVTIGGYLMREHRLTALKPLLDAAEQSRLAAAVATYHALLEENIVRSEDKARREVEARLRQWREHIRDLRRDARANAYSYPTAVEARVMLKHLLDMLDEYPYETDPDFAERLETLDGGLRSIWDMGDFVWPEEWQTAYPLKTFWYLYGWPITGRR